MPIGALVKCREWVQWTEYWRQTQPQTEGWQRFLVDAVMLCHQTCVRDARRLRSRAMLRHDHRGFSMDEIPGSDFIAVAARDLAWFERHAPARKREAPEWAGFLFEAIDGALRNRLRLAHEFDQVWRKGYLTVNVNPSARIPDFVAGREDFRGAEVEHV
jgi:hypothetical protein